MSWDRGEEEGQEGGQRPPPTMACHSRSDTTHLCFSSTNRPE
jgi:hypothetical protein